MEIAKLEALVAAVVSFLVQKEVRFGHPLKEHADVYGKMVEAAITQKTENAEEFVGHFR